MPISADFNPAKFLYYNPELTALSNILTNSQAYEWAYSNDIQGMASNDDVIKANFDSEMFVADYKRLLNASPLNTVIKAAMLAEGFSESKLANRARYMSTIYADAMIASNNVLKFNPIMARPEDMFYINSNSLAVGDMIKFTNKLSGVSEYATVTNLLDTETFQVANPRKVYNGIGEVYTVVGIKVWDTERLARINFLRGLNPAPEVPPKDAYVEIEERFNPELYRLLYPETDKMSDVQAYLDYVNHRDNSELRIGNVGDIPLSSNLFTPEFDYLSVNFRLQLDKDAGMQWGDKYVYGISKDDVTAASNLDKAHDMLVSEWAIKKYVDRSYEELAVFNNVVVNGHSLFRGPVEFEGGLNVDNLNVRSNADIGKDLRVKGMSFLEGNVQITGDSNYIENCTLCNNLFGGTNEFVSDVMMDRNLYVAGAAQAPRFGIGPAGFEIINNLNLDGIYNARVKTLACSETLDVGSRLAQGSVALSVHGFIQADNLNTVSDSRLKNVKGPFAMRGDPLDVLDAVTPILFSYKDDSNVSKLGFLADEVASVLPEAIIRIKKYDSACSLRARLLDGVLTIDDDGGYVVGDELYLGTLSCWVQILKVIEPNTFEVSRKVDDEEWNGVITKVRLGEVKTIDYFALLAAMWSALKEIRGQLRSHI